MLALLSFLHKGRIFLNETAVNNEEETNICRSGCCFLGAAALHSDVCLLRRLGLEPDLRRLSNMDFLWRRRPQLITHSSIVAVTRKAKTHTTQSTNKHAETPVHTSASTYGIFWFIWIPPKLLSCMDFTVEATISSLSISILIALQRVFILIWQQEWSSGITNFNTIPPPGP